MFLVQHCVRIQIIRCLHYEVINYNLSDILCEFSFYFMDFLGKIHFWTLVFTFQKYNHSLKWKN